MKMLDKIKEAKKNSHGVVFEKYQMPEITWEDMMNFIFKQSIVPNRDLQERVKKTNNVDSLDHIGNIQIQTKLWLAPQTNYLFDEFAGVSELLYKLNEETDNRTCKYYKTGHCDCDSKWHPQGIRMSLSDRIVPDHHDPYDIYYWQIVGTSYWQIDKGITHKLNPGDLLYLPLENTHKVWCDGPRAGLLIDNLKSKKL